MRTPGHDEDLVRGFLFSEGLVAGPGDIVRISEPAGLAAHEQGHVLDVDLVPGLEALGHERGTYASSACGTCGRRSLASLHVARGRIEDPVRVPRALLSALPERLRAAQAGFSQSGGSHACGLFSATGELLVLREDVGRHNAVDKVVGWALAQGRVPLAGCILMLSGRIAFELVEKAVLAGVPVLAAVGAPTSLALQVAEAHGLTLAGFVRPSSVNVYAGGERVLG
jgi:FdhD protein